MRTIFEEKCTFKGLVLLKDIRALVFLKNAPESILIIDNFLYAHRLKIAHRRKFNLVAFSRKWLRETEKMPPMPPSLLGLNRKYMTVLCAKTRQYASQGRCFVLGGIDECHFYSSQRKGCTLH